MRLISLLISTIVLASAIGTSVQAQELDQPTLQTYKAGADVNIMHRLLDIMTAQLTGAAVNFDYPVPTSADELSSLQDQLVEARHLVGEACGGIISSGFSTKLELMIRMLTMAELHDIVNRLQGHLIALRSHCTSLIEQVGQGDPADIQAAKDMSATKFAASQIALAIVRQLRDLQMYLPLTLRAFRQATSQD